jgi:mono/diheme cytochrome c family protein
MKNHSILMGLLGGTVGAFLIGISVWLIVAYTGAYNVAASDQHADAVRWTLDTTMHRSVASRAGGIDLPELSGELVAKGAAHYSESCVYCHGAPGQEPTEWSRGMRPQPPHLTEAAAEWTPREIHWIVENGIKMSGMPAFGEHHSREEIVALTAFVSALPGLTADDYASLPAPAHGRAEEAPTPTAGERQDSPAAPSE